MREHLISDLSVAAPSTALTRDPLADRWHLIPYETEGFSGTMLWCPSRNHPPEVAIPLPDLGLCRVHLGFYPSGTWPIWLGMLGMNDRTKELNRIEVRLSGDAWFDAITPEAFEGQPRFSYMSEAFWKVAGVSGQSLILRKPPKEAYLETSPVVAWIRLEPIREAEAFPNSTKRLVSYFDSNFNGHFVDSVEDVRSHFGPLRDADFDTVLWTACREDSCYYPTRLGNRLSDIGTRMGVYPYWAGRDMKRMLDRGEDPLRVACDVAHEYGLRFFSSYRRMTCRLPPFVFPLHPNAMLMKRRDLWCRNRDGTPLPHLSLAQPEVRRMTISLLTEQAENYGLDGVHLFFTRGLPLVFFEEPFVEAFRDEHGADPQALPWDDERVWRMRARFFLQFLRELRSSLDRVGAQKQRRLAIAINVPNRVRTCCYHGMDIETMVRERLVDLLIPDLGVFAPKELGDFRCTPETVAEFVALARGSGIQVRPMCDQKYWTDGKTLPQGAAGFYAAGADGLEVPMHLSVHRPEYEVRRRLGHIEDLPRGGDWAKGASRMVKVRTVGGFSIDMEVGIPTVG